jgi:hypothetical protein
MGETSLSEKITDVFPGDISITLGEDLECNILGGQEVSVFGRFCQMTVDPSSLLKAIIPSGGALGLFGAALVGSTGFTNFVYGQNVATVYGQNVDIKRAVKAEVSGENFLFEYLGKWTGSISPGVFKTPEMSGSLNAVGQVTTDRVVSVITTILAALQALSSLAFNLVLYLKYPAPNPADVEEQQLQNLKAEMEYIANNPLPPGTSVEQLEANAIGGTVPGPSATTILFRNLAWTIPNRLGALINEFELVGSAAREANQNLAVALKLKAFAENVKYGAIVSLFFLMDVGEAIGEFLKAIATRINAAIGEYKWVIAAIVAVLAVCAGILVMAMGMEGKL